MRFAATVYTCLALMFVPGFAVAQGNKLTDPQIAHIAYTAGQIDIQAAQLALKKSKSKEVRDFATQMER
jgi:putative membrane protein